MQEPCQLIAGAPAGAPGGKQARESAAKTPAKISPTPVTPMSKGPKYRRDFGAMPAAARQHRAHTTSRTTKLAI
jgi:hypothetical protein